MVITVDSAILWPNRRVYFFSGNEYRAFDIDANKVLAGYPKPTAANWPGLGSSAPQGAVVWPDGKAYFFNRDQTYRYHLDNGIETGFPAPTKNIWQGVLGGPQADHQVDVALLWPNGSGYLFQYDRYYRVNVGTKHVDAGYPQPILNNWPGLWVTGDNFRGGFVWPDLVDGRQKAYFFQGAIYFRYDVQNDGVDPGYPLPITGNWPGM